MIRKAIRRTDFTVVALSQNQLANAAQANGGNDQFGFLCAINRQLLGF
jgi:hypothetical protein